MNTKSIVRRVPAQMTEVAGSSIETARVSNTVEGECPVCHQPMKITTVNNVDAYCCLNDVIVLPIRS